MIRTFNINLSHIIASTFISLNLFLCLQDYILLSSFMHIDNVILVLQESESIY